MSGVDDDPGVVRGVSRLVGGFFVDELARGAVFFSLIVLVAAVVTRNPPYLALGAGVGLAGIVLPLLGMSRRWPDSTMGLVVSSLLVADAVTLWLLWTRA